MNSFRGRWIIVGSIFLFFVFLIGLPQAMAFVPLKGDLSKYDPANQTYPTSGDTIKIAIWEAFSGPNAYLGEACVASLGFVVQDINSQGGIKVDGKMKKIQIVKADTQSQVDMAKRAMEKSILKDNIHAFSGGAGTPITRVGQALAKEYKVLYVCNTGYADELTALPDFNEYFFRTCGTSTSLTKAAAVWYKKRPETKFYILGQDYVGGREFCSTFMKNVKALKPSAQIVGEEYFPLFTKDFAPYLEKVRASGAEVIVAYAWGADNENLIKQSRQMGLKSPLNPNIFIPMIGISTDDSRPLEAVGGPAGHGLVLNIDVDLDRRFPGAKKLNDIWNKLYRTTWKGPYHTTMYQWPKGGWIKYMTSYYWYFQAVQKAGSTDPKKVIAAWEGDTFDAFGQKHYMRPDDHQAIADRPICEIVFPNTWNYPNAAATGDLQWIAAKDCMPTFDEKLRGRVKK